MNWISSQTQNTQERCIQDSAKTPTNFLISVNRCSENFIIFPEKHPHRSAFFDKVLGYPILPGVVLLENLPLFENSYF